jgi:hypothetical protein
MIKTESLVNVAVIGIAAFLLLAATPVMAANPRGPVGSSAPEGLDPAFDPWGRAADQTIPMRRDVSCGPVTEIVQKELRLARAPDAERSGSG